MLLHILYLTSLHNKIRIAAPAEREQAAAWMAASEPWLTLGTSLEQTRRACQDPLYHVFVATSDGTACGAIVLQDKGVAGSPYIKSIVVAPGFRDKGIGGALLAFAEEHYRSSSQHLFLCVSDFNGKAQRFYKRNGYRQVGEFPDFVVAGKSELLFCKRLT